MNCFAYVTDFNIIQVRIEVSDDRNIHRTLNKMSVCYEFCQVYILRYHDWKINTSSRFDLSILKIWIMP